VSWALKFVRGRRPDVGLPPRLWKQYEIIHGNLARVLEESPLSVNYKQFVDELELTHQSIDSLLDVARYLKR